MNPPTSPGQPQISNAGSAGTRRVPPPLPGFSQVRRYFDGPLGKVTAQVLPGQYYVTLGDEAVCTTLGSCVAACVRDPVVGVGGINHFMLPDDGTDAVASSMRKNSDTARYGNHAMEILINAVLKNGGRRGRLEVKIFGGAVIAGTHGQVGKRNGEFVREYLELEGLRIQAADIGGSDARKVRYFPRTGKVQVMALARQDSAQLRAVEERYRGEVSRSSRSSGDVELF